MDYSTEPLGRYVPPTIAPRLPAKLLRLRLPRDLSLRLLLTGGGLLLALIIGYLIVDDKWWIAAVLLLAIPGAILFHNHPWLGLIVWLLFTPFLVETGGVLRQLYWLVHRLLPLAILGVMILSSMFRVRKLNIVRPVWFEWAMIAYFIVSMASAFTLSQVTEDAVFRVYDRVGVPMLLYLIVRLQVQDEDALARLLPVVLFICVSQALFGFLYVSARGVLPNFWLSTDGDRATGSLGSESVYGTTLLFAGALLLHAALSNKVSGFTRVIFLGAFAASLAAVFFSFSRGSWLAGTLVVAVLVAVYPKYLVRLLLIVVPIAIIAGGMLFADDIAYAQKRFGTDQTVRGRLPVMYASLQMFAVRPIFGWGYDNFDYYDRQFQGRVGDLASPRGDRASHNVYLTVAAEQGIIGVTLFLLPVVGLAVASLKKWPDLPSEGFWSRKLLIVAWSIILAHFTVNNFSNMRVVFGLGLYWTTLAIIAVVVLSDDLRSQTSLTLSGGRNDR